MDYQLKPIGKTCVRSGTPFRPGDACFSALVERTTGWVRLDFSVDVWKGPPDGAIGYWKCAVPQANETRRRSLHVDSLMRQFEQLCEDANPARDAFRYVLALLLVQRRRLRINGTRNDGSATFLELVGMQGEGPFQVRDENFDHDQIEALQRELIESFTDEAE